VSEISPTASGGTADGIMPDERAVNARRLRSNSNRYDLPARAEKQTDGDPIDAGERADNERTPPRLAVAREEAAAAGELPGGGIVRVKALIDDTGSLLRPAMTGYAKIRGRQIALGEVYLRLCTRFFAVVLWSWVP
jgi:hypothetical protein